MPAAARLRGGGEVRNPGPRTRAGSAGRGCARKRSGVGLSLRAGDG